MPIVLSHHDPTSQICTILLPRICTLFQQMVSINRFNKMDDYCIDRELHVGHITQYLYSLYEHIKCSPECIVNMVVLMDRYSRKTNIELNYMNVYRLMTISMVISAKTRDDCYYSNKYYSKIFNIFNETNNCSNINNLESVFLRDIDWDAHIDKLEHDEYISAIITYTS